MKQQLEEEAVLRQYLLGELAQEERVLIEKRLFLDGDYLLQLKAVEDELMDDYAYNELTVSEREKFETHLISNPVHREDLRIAKALKRYIASDAGAFAPAVTAAASSSTTGEVRKPLWRDRTSFLPAFLMRRPVAGSAFAAVALVVLSLIIWFSVKSLRDDDPTRRMQAQESTPQPTQPSERQQIDPEKVLQANRQPPDEGREVAAQEGATPKGAEGTEKEKLLERRAGQQRNATPPNARTPAQVATFLILPGGVVRGEGQRTGNVNVRSDVGTVNLRLPLVTGNDYRSYRATLQAGGQTIHTRANLKPEIDAEYGQVVSFKVPAKLLRTQSYRVKLGGLNAAGQTQDINSYAFQVEKQ